MPTQAHLTIARDDDSESVTLRNARRRRFSMTAHKRFSEDEAKKIGDKIGVDWTKYDLEQFRIVIAEN